MKPIAVNFLFRWINSLFGQSNSGFRTEQGICRNTLELPGELPTTSPKKDRKWPEFETFPVIFPVGRELEDEGRSCVRGSRDAVCAEDHCGWKFTLSSSAA